jgi:hypothetical protein
MQVQAKNNNIFNKHMVTSIGVLGEWKLISFGLFVGQ